MPVHGETAHAAAHARLAEEMGVDPRALFICENGDRVRARARRRCARGGGSRRA